MNAGPTPENLQARLLTKGVNFLNAYYKHFNIVEGHEGYPLITSPAWQDIESDFQGLLVELHENTTSESFNAVFGFMKDLSVLVESEVGRATHKNLITQASIILASLKFEEGGQFDSAFLTLMRFVDSLPKAEKPSIASFLDSGNLFGHKLRELKKLGVESSARLFKYLLGSNPGCEKKLSPKGYSTSDITFTLVNNDSVAEAILDKRITLHQVDRMRKALPTDAKSRVYETYWYPLRGIHVVARNRRLDSMELSDETPLLSEFLPARILEHFFDKHQGTSFVAAAMNTMGMMLNRPFEHSYFTLEKLIRIEHHAKKTLMYRFAQNADMEFNRAFLESQSGLKDSLEGLPQDWVDRMVETQVAAVREQLSL